MVPRSEERLVESSRCGAEVVDREPRTEPPVSILLSRGCSLPPVSRSGAENVRESLGETAPERGVAASVLPEDRTSSPDLTEPVVRGEVRVDGCVVDRELLTEPCVRISRTDVATR